MLPLTTSFRAAVCHNGTAVAIPIRTDHVIRHASPLHPSSHRCHSRLVGSTEPPGHCENSTSSLINLGGSNPLASLPPRLELLPMEAISKQDVDRQSGVRRRYDPQRVQTAPPLGFCRREPHVHVTPKLKRRGFERAQNSCPPIDLRYGLVLLPVRTTKQKHIVKHITFRCQDYQ
jgi:hypothetical protein